MIASRLESKWIALGAADEIEKNVELYRKSVRAESALYVVPRNVEAYRDSESSNTDQSAPHLVLRSLHDQVWAPIEKALPTSCKSIILCPDGALNFISFATLLTHNDEFLVEKYSIRYVASGRDLLWEREASATELVAVFGDPDFGNQPKSIDQQTETSSALAMRSSEMRDFEDTSLTALPGTDKECAGLKTRTKASGKPIEVFLGADATEAQLREISSPRILHLATHGFFLPESKDEDRSEHRQLEAEGMNLIGDPQKDRRTPVILKNPMHRSGLALAGAQRTLEAWAKGEAPPGRQRRNCHCRRGRRIELERHLARGAFRVRHGHWRGQSGRRGLGPAPRVYSGRCSEPVDDALANKRHDDSADHSRFLRPRFYERECTPVTHGCAARVAGKVAQGEWIALRGQSCGAIHHVVPGKRWARRHRKKVAADLCTQLPRWIPQDNPSELFSGSISPSRCHEKQGRAIYKAERQQAAAVGWA